MRLLVGAGLAATVLAILLAAPAGASQCETISCGVPQCWEPTVRARPDMDRTVRVGCWEVTGARLLTPPEHSDVSNVSSSADTYGFTFDVHPHGDAPRFEDAVFELDGYSGSIQQTVRIEVVPTSENRPPECDGDRAAERSDGSGPVDVFLHPVCWDPDGDDFTIEGGGPGEHPRSPEHVMAGDSEANWPYRTATSAGEETATIWATDSLGARSADAELKVTVGPDVDRLPQCQPGSWSLVDGVMSVFTRPGQVRRFGVVCEDPDGDLFASHLSALPEHGALALVEGPPQDWTRERWSDATYVPADDSLEPDHFSVTATGVKGDGPSVRMALVPRALPYNGGGGCGYSPLEVPSPGPGVVRIGCADEDGDPLTAEVVTQPKHGSVTSPVVTPSTYGSESVAIPYVPEEGYEGYDCIEVRITDGHGLEFELPIDIWVRPPVKVDPPDLPNLPDPPTLPDVPTVPDPPTAIPTPPVLPGVPTPRGSTKAVRPLVQGILGTHAVKRVRAAGGVQVWSRTKLPRRALLRRGQASGLVVICAAACRVRGEAVLAAGRTPIRSSRHRTFAALAAGDPDVLSLALGDAERQELRRLRRPRATFKLSVHPARGPVTSLRRSMRVAG